MMMMTYEEVWKT